MNWYKINFLVDEPSFDNAFDFIERLCQVAHSAPNYNPDIFAIFSKIAPNHSRNVYFTEHAFKLLENQLSKFDSFHSSPPTKNNDEQGTHLTFHCGNEKLLL